MLEVFYESRSTLCESIMDKQFDPHWPFPQYDEEGNRLMPEDFDPKPTPKEWPGDIEEALL